MIIASVFCIFIGSYTPYLYKMLPYQSTAADYALMVYSSYHVAESLQILLFTALGFFLFIKKLAPEPTISIDLDWFYRKGGRGFLWLAKKPIQSTDNAVNTAYTWLGLTPLMTSARFWSWFDWHAIDGVVDGIARGVRGIGGRVRQLQAGQLQVNIFYTVAIAAVLLILFALSN